MTKPALRPRPMRFAFAGQSPAMKLAREDALDLLEWLGLGRPEFGAVDVRTLLPLCRRRLWPEARNHDPARELRDGMRPAGTLHRLTQELASLVARSPEGLLVFG